MLGGCSRSSGHRYLRSRLTLLTACSRYLHGYQRCCGCAAIDATALTHVCDYEQATDENLLFVLVACCVVVGDSLYTCRYPNPQSALFTGQSGVSDVQVRHSCGLPTCINVAY